MTDRGDRPGAAPASQAGVPQISLPRGGGALKSIGEKLSINPATGSASLSLPLPLPPGRGAAGPALSLTYDSGRGLGPFGLGWSLDLPRISRRTERRLPRYRTGDSPDVFILSGAEDLVPARRFDGNEWKAEERLEGAHRVTRYRPRQEGSHARIERWSDLSGNDLFWKSISKDNVTSVYGVDTDSRIFDPSDPSRIFAWLLKEVRDDRGDLVRYHYKPEDDSGLPLSPAENNRRGGQAVAQRYLKRIEYGVDQPVGVSAQASDPLFHFEIVIDYGEHELLAPTPAETGIWAYRADPSSDFRPGFDLRTRRLARRVLVFRRFADLGAEPVLTRSLDLEYDHDPAGARLTGVVERGWDSAGIAAERPRLSFAYSRARPDTEVRTLDSESFANLPQGIDNRRFRLVDLYEEAAPGVLIDESDAWLFKRNGGDGRFEPLEIVAEKPNWARLDAGAALEQLEADGRLYATRRAAPAGYSARRDDGGWEPFRAFDEEAAIDWADPVLRHADLDGDGRPDALLLRDDVIRWHRNRGRQGHSAESRAFTGDDEEAGPARVLGDGPHGLFLADMTGDGLSDIVRIGNGSICYWPNLGYGRFGAKVTMAGAPRFDRPDLFDHARLRLGDIDGSGTSDLLYLGRDSCRWWRNQAGNSWSSRESIPLGFPTSDSMTEVVLADLLGIGTSCLIWSSARPHDQARPLRFIDLMGGVKPYLLVGIDNGAGARTDIEYQASGAQYRADRRAGRPWLTRLPFPVHVVSRVVHHDLLSGGRLASQYVYRHGFFDRAEREFRGFAMVEQRDTETVAMPAPHDLAPVVTRSWFHTGAWSPGTVSDAHGSDYYQGTLRLPDSRIEGTASQREEREAIRALRGQLLRREVYAFDGSPSENQPYLVTETRCLVRRLQPCGPGEDDHGVFSASPIESLTQHLERNDADPRILHELTLDLDSYGNPLRRLQVAYPRRAPMRPGEAALAAVAADQGALLATVEEAGFAADVQDPGRHRHSLPVWNARFEVGGLVHAGPILTLDEARNAIDAIASITPFHAQPPPGHSLRLLGAEATLFRTDASAGADLGAIPLPFGKVQPLALPYRSYRLALTEDLLDSVIGSRRSDAQVDLNADGYVARSFTLPLASGLEAPADGWWIASPLHAFAGSGFFLPDRSRDTFGNLWTTAYGEGWLAPVSVTDPVGTTVSARIDYRHLLPGELEDQNGNLTRIAFDPFGRVTAVAVGGKPSSGEGDDLSGPTETYDHVETEVAAGRPNFVHVRRRESHGDPASRWLEHRIYSDGFGREFARKVRVRPGPASYVDGDGLLQTGHADPRWVGSGRTIYDNKGNVLRRYEPYFSVTEAYEEEDSLRLWGVSCEMRYDPLGRPVATRFPDLSEARTLLGAWREESWDRNDNLFAGAPWDKAAAGNPAGSKNERARALAEAHSGTPDVAHLDPLGRAILVEADNKAGATYKSRRLLDIDGRIREMWDANGNRALLEVHDLAGRAIRVASNDSAESFALADADGRPRHIWKPRGHYLRQDYDELRRPTATLVVDPLGGPTVPRRIVYGESAPNAGASNLLGETWLVLDGGGALRRPGYDFKGNPLSEERFPLADPSAVADWAWAPPDPQIAAWFAGQAALFDVHCRRDLAYDALDRPVLERAPDGTRTHYAYDEGGALKSIGLTALPGRSAPAVAVADTGYDAKGQRAWIEYGNGIATFYTYEPTTDRLSVLLATRDYHRDSDGLPVPDPAQPAPLQHLLYVYDPVGNIVEIEDLAQDKVYNEGQVEPRRLYEYDPLYRLTVARGREHESQTGGGAQYRVPGALPQALPADTDMRRLRRYVQRYTYDSVGNIVRMRHVAPGGSWTRDYLYDYQRAGSSAASPFPPGSHPGGSNRLYSTTLSGGGTDLYEHDIAGNILSLPSIDSIDWDGEDRPSFMRIGTVDCHYRYDGEGERARKLVDKGNVKEERLYLGGFEIYRRWVGGALDLRRDSLHVRDDGRRILLIETEKDSSGAAAAGAAPVLRFQLDDHLQSAALEVDELGQPISYEELHPYGTTALHWANTSISQKRYRHTGMERDEESGLQYHSARYFVPWLGRWLSADPSGAQNGINLYAYAEASPLVWRDSNGLQIEDPLKKKQGGTAVQSPMTKFTAQYAQKQKDALAKLQRIVEIQYEMAKSRGPALVGSEDVRPKSDHLASFSGSKVQPTGLAAELTKLMKGTEPIVKVADGKTGTALDGFSGQPNTSSAFATVIPGLQIDDIQFYFPAAAYRSFNPEWRPVLPPCGRCDQVFWEPLFITAEVELIETFGVVGKLASKYPTLSKLAKYSYVEFGPGGVEVGLKFGKATLGTDVADPDLTFGFEIFEGVSVKIPYSEKPHLEFDKPNMKLTDKNGTFEIEFDPPVTGKH